jgi:hypothetical protein
MVNTHISRTAARRWLRVALVAAPALIISACTSVTAPLFTSWEGTVQPIFPSTVGGRVAAVTQFGRTEASIVMEEGEADVVYRWRINAGSCQEEGAIQGGLAAYPPLVVSEVGSSSADVTLNTEFENGDQFAARIYIQEEGGSNEVIGCGNLDQIQ